MTVEQLDVVDSVVVKVAERETWLVIAAHLDWVTDLRRHLDLLVKKLNRYVAFIEEGELANQFPSSVARKLRIAIFATYEPPQNLEKLVFKKIRYSCEQQGIAFEVRHRPIEGEWRV